MPFREIFLILVVAAFSSLGVTLFVVAWWSNLPGPARARTLVAPARRPDEAQARREKHLQT